MAERLPSGPEVVMTAVAGAKYFKVIHPRHRRPSKRLMARAALIGRGNVVGRLRGRAYRTGAAMAAGAVTGRCGGNALLVAAVAARAGMRAFQPKAGTEMIKLRGERGPAGQHQAERLNLNESLQQPPHH